MTIAQRLTELRSTVAFLSRHRERHLRSCKCNGQCQQSLAMVAAIQDARERAAAMISKTETQTEITT